MRQQTPLSRHIVVEAATVHDLAACVIANGGEPNYATEKLIRAFRATTRALIALGCNPSDLVAYINRQASR